MLYIEHGRVNEYLMPFPLFLSTVPFTNIHFLSSLSVGITSPVITPSPSLPLSVHPCTFFFRRAPLVPGTASHTRLMASLERRASGGWSQDGDHRQAQNHSYFLTLSKTVFTVSIHAKTTKRILCNLGKKTRAYKLTGTAQHNSQLNANVIMLIFSHWQCSHKDAHQI